jgi:hypothetical protein
LLEWLERKALHGDTLASDPGGLAEANRLAPDDGRIAFWYITSLVSAGEGQAARGVFEKHRDKLVNQYPTRASELEHRIAQRCKIEQRPTAFVQRYDQIGLQLGGAAKLPSDETLMAAAFRLVDQKGEAVPAHSLSPSDSDCRIEPFADGWFLCTYLARNPSRDETIKVRLTDPAYDSQEYDIQVGADAIRESGEFRAQKRGAMDLVKTRFKVIGSGDKPLEGARLTLRPSQSSRGEASLVQITTSASGMAAEKLFPGDYFVSTLASNYLPHTQNIRVEAVGGGAGGEDAKPTEIRLVKSMKGTVRVAWRIVDDQTEVDDEREQVADLNFANGQLSHMGAIPGMWLHIRQSNEGLFFSAADQRLLYRPTPGGEAWTRVTDEEFDSIGLDDLTELKKSSNKPKRVSVDPTRVSMPMPFQMGSPFALQPGKVYFGETPFMFPNTGPPSVKTLRYKLVFDALGDEKPADKETDSEQESPLKKEPKGAGEASGDDENDGHGEATPDD